MPLSWMPHIFNPDYTWPCPIKSQISTRTPQIPSVSGPVVRRVWGVFHRFLAWFSEIYCSWYDVPYCTPILQLPFGLVLKWSERTRIEEVVAMKMARAAGMPVPKVLCYGDHPNDWRGVSILMTRLPGWSLNNSRDDFIEDDEQPWFSELARCFHAMRKWEHPFEGEPICSVLNTTISSPRVPGHAMGPFESEEKMHDYLESTASARGFKSLEAFESTLAQAKQLRTLDHSIVFTHGDFKAHNLLVDDEYRLSGFLDWECTGWYPEYWELTTAMKYGKGTWWYMAMMRLGADKYETEIESERALNNLTVDSWAGF